MGRRNSHPRDKSKRDALDIATESEVLSTILRSSSKPRPIVLSPPTFDLRPLEDLRTWHPSPRTRPAAAVERSSTQLVPRAGRTKFSRPHGPPSRVGFRRPSRVLVCIRRKRRKQVLFALNKTRKGARARKRRNSWSNVSCSIF